MKINLLFATGNEHKTSEVRKMMPYNINIQSLKDINFTEDIPETGKTFEENALQKAQYLYNKINSKYIFAEDSGLEVKSLNGAPGIYTARYAGINKNNDDNINLLLKNLNNIKEREAQFTASICLLIAGKPHYFNGHISGEIADKVQGEGGFGYDPIFIPNGYKNSFAILGDKIKNGISHRKIAITKMIDFLKEHVK